ncbi:MAG: hypothetical protein HF978_13565 [Desulfobacteraceae bacterium]|nr:NifB/NifX family molybdenum-iron cluster-binding protein [Desulfobacteraceae bacterium]MBC2756571.1 hypothetical protein [Desulfobacteraceae bacterium]
MRVALTAWEDRISPVFDSAKTLLIAEIENREIVNRRYEAFIPEMSSRLAGMLSGLGLDVLICGAISQIPAGIIETCGIRLIPFIGGNVEEVLVSYANGEEIVPVFSMPGCGRRHRQKRGRVAFLNQQKEVRNMPGGDRTGPQGNGPGTGRGSGGGNKGKPGKIPGQGQGQGQGQGRGRGGRPGQGTGQGRGKRN